MLGVGRFPTPNPGPWYDEFVNKPKAVLETIARSKEGLGQSRPKER
jgi:hypothetical protein